MSNRPVRLLINSAEFPFLSTQAGRDIIDNADLNSRMPAVFYGNKESVEFGVPKLLYCENMIPFAKGLMSIGYTTQVTAITGPATVQCDQMIALRDTAENQFTFIPAKGANYVYTPTTGVWASVNPFTFSGNLVTRAYVNGRTFICYEKNRILEYNSGTGLFTTISLTFPTGITIADVRGIGNASNYLLLFTTLSVYWCSPLNIFDFATIDQGAGQQTPLDIKGQIVCVLACSGGFIIYTSRNAIGATFTNNGNAPFVFKEIQNCGGTSSWERVTVDSDEVGHYLWGTNGLQKVGLNNAETIHPAVTDFLVGGILEAWNPATKAINSMAVGNPFSVKLCYLVGRYLLISYGYGTDTYTNALVYDTVLDRWGKINIPHVDAFSYTYPAGVGSWNYENLVGSYSDLGDDTYDSLDITRLIVPPAKRGMAFLKNTGEINVLTSDFVAASSGVAIFGHIQQRHDRLVTITSVELEGVSAPVVTLLGSSDGRNRDTISATDLVNNVGTFCNYHAYVTAKNFDIAIEGAMQLSTAMVRVKHNGYR